MPRFGERFVYHVTPYASGESWIVTLENGNLRREFDTKEAAEKFAKYRARLNQLSQVKVHKQTEIWIMNPPTEKTQEIFHDKKPKMNNHQRKEVANDDERVFSKDLEQLIDGL